MNGPDPLSSDTRSLRLFRALAQLRILPTRDRDTIHEAFQREIQLVSPDCLVTESEQLAAYRPFIMLSEAREYALSMIDTHEVQEEFDSTPLTLGYAGRNGLMQPIFRIGTFIPCWSIQSIRLVPDSRKALVLELFQGIRPFVHDCLRLATVAFCRAVDSELPLVLRARFDIDQYGILTLTDAWDLAREAGLDFTLTSHGGASGHMMELHRIEARAHAVADRERAARW